VPVPDCSCLAVAEVSALWAYFGISPGQELVHYFFALVGTGAVGLIAVLQWPLFAVRRMLSRGPTASEADSIPGREPDSAT
jgi:hypothetical protein